MFKELKKLFKLRNRRALGFASISFFATIVLARIHPALAQTSEKNITGNSAMPTALLINVLEVLTASLFVISLVSAIVGVYSTRGGNNSLSAVGMSLLGSLMGLLFIVLGAGLFLEQWTPILVAIAWLNAGIFLGVLDFALTH